MSKALKPKITRSKPQRLPVKSSADNTDELNKKLAYIAELHNGMEILKTRMADSKRDLMAYFENNPHLKKNKYNVSSRFIRYVDRKVNDGISQKLIIKGLTEYFKLCGDSNVENKVAEALTAILSQRSTKVVPNIEITKAGQLSLSSNQIDDDEEL